MNACSRACGLPEMEESRAGWWRYLFREKLSVDGSIELKIIKCKERSPEQK
jgi:hypothetical protein